MNTKDGLRRKINIILSAVFLLAQLFVYAQADDIARPNIQRPNIQRPKIDRPNIERPTISRPSIPAPLELSPSQRAAMTKAAKQKAAAQQAAAMQAAAQQATGQLSAGQEAASQQVGFDECGVPMFTPPQYFPQGPSQQLPPISKIRVPSPSLPPAIGSVVSLVNDCNSSTPWISYGECDDCGISAEVETAHALLVGQMVGFTVGKEGFASCMDTFVVTDYYSFAFQLGFLQGLLASECDPDVYMTLYQEMLKRLKAGEEKKKKNQIDMFAPCVPSSQGGGGAPPC